MNGRVSGQDAMVYPGAEHYEVELFDRVEVTLTPELGGHTCEGIIKKLHPKSRTVTVRYEDHRDYGRTTGEPKMKTARVFLAAVELIARDG